MATPTEAAISRCGSLVALSLITAKTICPGVRYFSPSCWLSNLQFGGKIDLTRTRLNSAIPADRSASSKEVSFSRCRPTPFVRNVPFGIGPIYFLSDRSRWSPWLIFTVRFLLYESARRTLHSIHRRVFAEYFA